jgi:hypothetical protein
MPAKTTPKDICKRYYERGLYGALYDAPRPGQPPKLNGKIALVSGVSNDGQIGQTVTPLAQRVKEGALSAAEIVGTVKRLSTVLQLKTMSLFVDILSCDVGPGLRPWV